MRYKARAYNESTKALEFAAIDAGDEAELRDLLRDRGLTLLSARPAPLPGLLGFGRRGVKLDVEEWCTQMARLLRAGMSLPEALEAQGLRLKERGDNGLARVYEELRSRLMEGKRLSEAMATTNRFAPMLIAAVQASERSGKVAGALEEYARHEGAMRDLRRRILNAAIYPSLVIVFGFLVALFLLGYVVPRFSRVFADSHLKVSSSTGAIIAVGSAINDHPVLVLAVLAGTISSGIILARSPAVRRRVGDFVADFGPVRCWFAELQLTRICQSMAMLIANGFTIPAAMKLATPLAIRADLQEAMKRATELVETGSMTSVAWQQSGLAQSFAARVLQAGERTGDLAACFESLAQTYRIQVQTKLERASRLAEPILLVVVACLIGTIVVLMYLPIVDLATAAG